MTPAGVMTQVQAQVYQKGALLADPGNSRSMISDYSGRLLEKTQNGLRTHVLIANGEMIGQNSATHESFSTVHEGLATASNASVSVYVVQNAGDKLTSIAKAIWGDERLWYLIADANGLSISDTLTVGQPLTIPAQAGTTFNGADTFKPYNAAEIIGNTTPEVALPAPQQSGGGCGGLGQLVMIVVAVVATIYTAGAASTMIGAAGAGAGAGVGAAAGAAVGMAGTAGISATWAAGIGVMTGAAGFTASAVAAGAIGGALGSIVSQAVGIAIGAQDSFNWKGVALSAIGSGVSAGVAGLAKAGSLGSVFKGEQWSAAAARAAVSNTVTQGLSVATGLQGSFEWRNVAASAVGAAVGARTNEYLGANNALAGVFKDSDLARGSAVGFAAGIATAVARGGKIEIARIATDAFGNALGNSLAENTGGASKAKAPFDATDMQSLIKNGRLTASLGGSGSPMRSWSGDGEIMSDFDLSDRVYGNEHEYQNRDNSSGLQPSWNISADDLMMQQVVVGAKRLDPQAQEDWQKYQMRASMPDFGRAAPTGRSRAPGAAVVRLNQQWDQAKNRLVDASHRAGVDPGTVAKIAAFESRFDPTARPIARDASRNKIRQFDGVMAVSSAYGYGQFTDAGWTDTVNRYGQMYGIENAARLNNVGAAAYRTDVDLQANMLAEFTKANVIKGRALGGSSDDANVYALHNLGSGDGPRFLRALANDPTREVSDVLSRAVIRGNPSLYTLQDAYGKMGAAMANGNRFAEDARALLRAKYGH